MNDETLEAVRRDYQVFTAIEQQLRDCVNQFNLAEKNKLQVMADGLGTALQVIQQHKADLFQKYPL